MQIHRLFRQLWVRQPVETVFPFFERPENLAEITPPELGFELLTPSPVPMHMGALIDYRIRLLLGIPVRWTSYIAAYDPPRYFVDVQLRGPYSFWHHTHRFEPHQDGTLITDDVLYALPLGPIGDLAHRLWVERALRHIFDYRQRRLAALFHSS
ncbi:MAG: SRPBCC family protein [Blastocatellia bacterium]|nr:SRPBCC family protein [Blastocatellia bacterium]